MAHSYSQLNSDAASIHFSNVKQKITGSIIVVLWTLFPGIIGNMLMKQFFTPKRYPLSQDQDKYLKTGRAFDLRINDDTIKCRQWGEGPAIICVHGWGGIGLQFQGVIDRAVASGFSVIVFDGPGHGLSSGKTCSYFQMTDVVRTLLCETDAVAGLIGHSFGAAAIINSLSKENIKLPAVLIAPALQLVQMIDTAFAYYGIPLQIYMKLIAQFEEKYGYSFEEDNPIHLLDNDNQAFLIVHDREDRVIPYNDSKKTVHRFPSFELMTTRNLGHKNLLKDEKVIKASLAFIQESKKFK